MARGSAGEWDGARYEGRKEGKEERRRPAREERSEAGRKERMIKQQPGATGDYRGGSNGEKVGEGSLHGRDGSKTHLNISNSPLWRAFLHTTCGTLQIKIAF